MIKIIFITVFLLAVNRWIPVVAGVSVLFIVLVLLGKHDMEWFETSGLYRWDAIGYRLVLLRVWIIVLMLIARGRVYLNNNFRSLFSLVCIFLLLTLVFAFSTSNILIFYVFFEASLIPTFILILGWGYQPERIQAGVYIIIYTVFASLPLLVVLFNFYGEEHTGGMITLEVLPSYTRLIIIIGAILAFIVKLPVYLVHLWLPKAHVEAPVAGSMILARVLLKLGGYGLVRVSSKVASSFFSIGWLPMAWGLIGGVYVRFTCLRQTDVKCLIALSSVAHMSIVFGGILTFTKWGLNGALLVIIGHGFCSSGLFCIANISYERSGTRSLQIIKGIQAIYPQLTLWWFLLVAANIAAPPSINLIGEIRSIVGLLGWSFWTLLPVAGLTFLAAAYSLYLYSRTQHGKYFSASFTGIPVGPREYLVLLAHWLPINFIIIKFSCIQIFVCFVSLW